MKKTFLYTLMSLTLVGFMQPALLAQPETETRTETSTEQTNQSQETQQTPQQEAKPIDRFGLSVIPGVNVISPFLGVQASYRPPLFEDKFRIVAQYDFYNSGWYPGYDPQYALLGLRYDFFEPTQTFRPYAQWLVGATLLVPQAPNTAINFGLASELAVGVEAQLIGPLWGFAQIGAFYPILVRSVLGLRLAF